MKKNLTIGDYVVTNYKTPFMINMHFEIEEIRDVAKIPHAFGKYGSFPLKLLKRTKRPVIVKPKKPTKQFLIDEVINHPKFGIGTVSQVFDFHVIIIFGQKPIKFNSYLLEKTLKRVLENK